MAFSVKMFQVAWSLETDGTRLEFCKRPKNNWIWTNYWETVC